MKSEPKAFVVTDGNGNYLNQSRGEDRAFCTSFLHEAGVFSSEGKAKTAWRHATAWMRRENTSRERRYANHPSDVQYPYRTVPAFQPLEVTITLKE